MKVNELQRKRVAGEWDGAWFCDKCEKLMHWKTEAYMVNNRPLCKECAEERIKEAEKNHESV